MNRSGLISSRTICVATYFFFAAFRAASFFALAPLVAIFFVAFVAFCLLLLSLCFLWPCLAFVAFVAFFAFVAFVAFVALTAFLVLRRRSRNQITCLSLWLLLGKYSS